VSRDLMSQYGTDAVVAGIVADNRALCARVPAPGTPEPGQTPSPTP